MDQVSPGLFVGTVEDAGDESLLRENGVDRVVSLTHGDPEAGFSGSTSVSRFEMMDGPRNDRQVFEKAVESVVSGLGSGEVVLVHCSRGASRSPSVAACAVALHQGVRIEEAFEQVAGNRSEFDPHDSLVRQAVDVFQGLSD